jgi:hypothetical protein
MSSEREIQSRRRLARILGISESASDGEFQVAAERLLGVLRRRQRAAASSPGSLAEADSSLGKSARTSSNSTPAEQSQPPKTDRALELEIVALVSGLERWVSTESEAGDQAGKVDRTSLAGALIGAGVTLALLVAYASGMRIVWQDGDGFASSLEEPATLMLTGRLPGATLRVLDADRDQLFVKTAAEGAIVELSQGRYAIDVSREDCPDHWTRSVYFEAGATHRYEPYLCVGEGEVTIRSTVTGDRLIIDGFDVGATSAEPHTLGVGDHQIRVEKAGYVPFESLVRIEPDVKLALRAELVTEQEAGPAARPGYPVPFESPDLTSMSDLKPEPFDLRDLQQEIAPRKKGTGQTSLLRREGAAGLPDGGSTAWHDRVSAELLMRFDTDGSGRIDRLEESESISCALWQEVEQDFERGGLGLSMARYFGFDGSEWHPSALGFSRDMRSAAYEKMKECGLQD